MSKKRQTRKEKLVAQSRRESITPPQYSISSFINAPKKEFSPTISAKPHSYAYVITDTQHTLIITLVILLLNSLAYVLLQKHVINIPFLGF